MKYRDIKNQLLLIIFMFVASMAAVMTVEAKGFSIKAPGKSVKLIFIHHSVGENWLSDGDGGFGRALGKNNYFVSDTNYGWGPSNIGDRTDIVNWTEWFASSSTNKYMKALLHENSRHSSYTRNMSDPGGKNKIIMFKSCYPNSEIQGSPNDRPRSGQGLTVSNAKATYNRLLSYFVKHPELLFIAITAPPVQDRSLSNNARAFNNWLIYDWLKTYKGYNVGVYDFYNTLTGPDNHHRISKNRVEHIYQKGRNALYYAPVGDDHPLTTGNKKAVREFIPLLNFYYNNFKQKISYTAPKRKILTKSVKKVQSKQEKPVTKVKKEKKSFSSKKAASTIADFEGGCSKWAVFSDAHKDTKIEFKCESKKQKKQAHSLKIEYKVSKDGWGTCSLVYPSPKSFKTKKGISLRMLAKSAGQKINFIVYQGKASDDLHHFEINITTDRKMVQNWQEIKIPFNKLRRPSWEGNQNDRIDLNLIQGVALGFDGNNNNKKSSIWIDDIKLY